MDKKSIKQFLKPDWRKILIGIILTAVSYFVASWSGLGMGMEYNYGFPFPYLELVITDVAEMRFYSIFYLGLIVDLIFWYFISCSIIFAWDKFIKKSRYTK